jgi:Late embryogenesis abundant protein
MTLSRRHWLQSSGLSMAGLMALTLASGCAGLPGAEEPRVTIVGLAPLTGEGFEMRFAVKLRIQNANPTDLIFDGVVLDLDVNGRPLASGVSDEKGTVTRYGQTVITVPVSVHAVGVIRQLLTLAADPGTLAELPYSARGRLGGGWHLGTRFVAEGVLKLPK